MKLGPPPMWIICCDQCGQTYRTVASQNNKAVTVAEFPIDWLMLCETAPRLIVQKSYCRACAPGVWGAVHEEARKGENLQAITRNS